MRGGGGSNCGDGGAVEVLRLVRGWSILVGYLHLRGRWLLHFMTGWELQILETGVTLSQPGALHP